MKPIQTLAFALALSLPAATALAQRPQSPAMTCRQAAGLVFARGAVVLGTGGHTYDRYVRDRGFCEVTEIDEARLRPDPRQSAMPRRLPLLRAERTAVGRLNHHG